MKLQDVSLVKIVHSDETETVLRAAIQQLNIAGRRVVQLTPTKEGWLLLHENTAPDAPPTKAGPPAIRAVPDVLTLTPGETRPLLILFDNMPPMELDYTTISPGGGSVSPTGLYTAPQASGIYEVKVACHAHPQIETRVYISVNPHKPKVL